LPLQDDDGTPRVTTLPQEYQQYYYHILQQQQAQQQQPISPQEVSVFNAAEVDSLSLMRNLELTTL
jgi:hypothetical protein